MPIEEVFPHPTVKQVIFQIRYPNLFYIESKIGDLQLKLMEQYPESSLIFRQQLLVADLGSQVSPEGISADLSKETGRKIWRFQSQQGVIINVLTDSLDISSQYHKTYNLPDGDRFRDTIQFVVTSFLEIAPVPMFTRVGLRYIDECPIPAKDKQTFAEWYNTTFPLDRFDIADAEEMRFNVITQRGDHKIRYVETLKNTEEGYKLFLDFDGFAENVPAINYLDVTDTLHADIAAEYETTIKDPVIQYMKRGEP